MSFFLYFVSVDYLFGGLGNFFKSGQCKLAHVCLILSFQKFAVKVIEYDLKY